MSKTENFDWTITLAADDEATEQKVSMNIESPQTGDCSLITPTGGSQVGSVKNVPVGKGSQLHGKKMYCQALVTDFDTQSNKMTVVVKCGKYSKSFTAAASYQGESIQFKITVIFI
jgi:Tfp pilus assembly protein PilW